MLLLEGISDLHSVCILPFPRGAKLTAKNKKAVQEQEKLMKTSVHSFFSSVLFILPLQLGAGLLDWATGSCKVWTSLAFSTGGDGRGSF